MLDRPPGYLCFTEGLEAGEVEIVLCPSFNCISCNWGGKNPEKIRNIVGFVGLVCIRFLFSF